MRTYGTDKESLKEIEQLGAETWQLDLLKLNPSYVYWGCFEDYMSTDKGWEAKVIEPNWKSHGWDLDDLNELVNFYFEVYRKNHQCKSCEGSGLNKTTKQLSEDWYDFNNTGKKWCYKLTDVEVLALAKAGRLFNFMDQKIYFDEKLEKWITWINSEKIVLEEAPILPTAEEVNSIALKGGIANHDAINRCVCVKARADYLGIYGNCENCEGVGHIYDEDRARVALQLWYLHPRKGCSRGVYIENVEQEDVSKIIEYLKKAKDRNNERFSKL